MTEFPKPVRIVLTGYADLKNLLDAVNQGIVYQYFTKPFSADEFKISLNNAVKLYYLIEERRILLEKLAKYENIDPSNFM